MRRLAIVSLLALASADASYAQTVAPPPVTTIIPDVAPGKSLGTIVSASGKTSTIDGGTLRGSNLFHSFSNFNLALGDVAKWEHSASDPTKIRNVINRITGGEPSSIYGTLDSTALSKADFFFINPAGIIFGEGAQLDVPAAAHFSTASQLSFADGQILSVATLGGSTLSMASPRAFGFLGNEGSITLSHVELSGAPLAENGQADALTFSGTNIGLDNASLFAEQIALSAVGDGATTLVIGDEAAPTLRGNLSISNSLIGAALVGQIETEPSEAIIMNAGTAVLNHSDIGVFLSATGDDVAGILLRAKDATLTKSSISHHVHRSGEAIGGEDFRVRISADSLTLRHSDIQTTSEKGYGGDIDIDVTGHLSMENSALGSSPEVLGSSGAISIKASSMDMLNSSLASKATTELGDGGSIHIDVAGLLRMQSSTLDTSIERAPSPADFRTYRAGSIYVQADKIDLIRSRMSSAAIGSEGQSGTVTVVADELKMAQGSVLSTSSANHNSAGQIKISADTISLDGLGTEITSSNVETGNAGSILIEVIGNVLLSEGAAIRTVAQLGAAGNITLALAPSSILLLEGRQATSNINTSVLNGGLQGAGGVITISNPLAVISNGGSILALGERGGANVLIDTSYFISSTDRENAVDVDGTLNFTNSIYDVSSGTVDPDLSVLDASAVLRGQCGTVRASGTVSQLDIRHIGPFGSQASSEAPRQGDHTDTSGGCH